MEMRKVIPVLGSLLTAGFIHNKFRSRDDLQDKVVLITGGSTGLGLVLATHLLKEKCKVAICARNEADLQKAHDFLSQGEGEIFHAVCDVSVQTQVEKLITDVTNHFGHIDIVINNAGIIMIGGFESYQESDYRMAMDVMYWGIVHTTLAVIPQMKARKSGQIVNITSVGGKVSIPHLLAYSASKFAAVGFSEGLSAELKKDRVYVTTIIPGLMRTGSYINALFQRRNKNAFKLFSAVSTMPGITISAESAARGVISAIKRRKSLKVIGLPAKALIEFHHFFPETTIRLFGIVSRYLPSSTEHQDFERGENILTRSENTEVPGLKTIGQKLRSEHQLKELH